MINRARLRGKPLDSDCKPITPKKKKTEKILSNGDSAYILYADGTWMKKEKK